MLQPVDSLVIDVRNNDPASRPGIDAQRWPGDGGLGLVLAQRLGQDVGWYPTGAGKSVWASLYKPTTQRSTADPAGH
jgi:hypothetical protein